MACRCAGAIVDDRRSLPPRSLYAALDRCLHPVDGHCAHPLMRVQPNALPIDGRVNERLDVIYYGPDETRFEPSREAAADLRGEYGWPPDTPLIGMVAYFYPELERNRWTPPAVHGRPVKCHTDLIKAMPAVLKERPDAKLLLVGSGWEEGGRQFLAKMQALVDELELSQSVKFTGYRTDIPAVLKALDVAVQASLSENLGGSIEALLMECPMVATRVGGLVDSVIDGETGVLVGPGDPAELARGILQLLRDRPMAREFGRRGRRLMLEKFTLRRTVEAENLLYQGLSTKGTSRLPSALPCASVDWRSICRRLSGLSLRRVRRQSAPGVGCRLASVALPRASSPDLACGQCDAQASRPRGGCRVARGRRRHPGQRAVRLGYDRAATADRSAASAGGTDDALPVLRLCRPAEARLGPSSPASRPPSSPSRALAKRPR